MPQELFVFEIKVPFSIRKVKSTIKRHYKKPCNKLTRRELVTLLQSFCNAKIYEATSVNIHGIKLEGRMDGGAFVKIIDKELQSVENGAPFRVIFTYKNRQLILTAK